MDDSLASAKLFMESSNREGLKARIVYIDLPQHHALLSKGRYTKNLIIQPDKKFQEDLAKQVLAVPMTPIVGSTLIRPATANLQDYTNKIGTKMTPSRTLFVPIDMPPAFEKHFKSGARRALGPTSDSNDRSGVMFSMSCIGARETSAVLDETQEAEEDDDEEEVEGGGDDEAAALEGVSLETMTPQQMRRAFGRSTLSMLGAMFQHSSRICEQGRFLDPKEFIQHVKENGKKAVMRKGQLHPTVVLSAMKSLLSSTSTGIGPQDVFIQVCGGTPEASVAAILAGFSHVLYVGSPQEQKWMKLPSESEESMCKIDYSAYNSPNVELPDEGILVAEAVLMLAPFIRNYVFETANAIKIAPPNQIRIPPLRTYTFIAVTGRVVARTVLPEQRDEDEQPTKKAKTGSSPSGPTSSSGGPGSASGKAPLKTPRKKEGQSQRGR